MVFSNMAISPFQHHPQMPLIPIAEREIDGVQMGVLSDGTAYLTARGLARMCGTPHSVLTRLANGWADERFKPRGRRIDEVLAGQGLYVDALAMRTQISGTETLAFPDSVCMAILEYYAFDAGSDSNATALSNYRLLARSSFRAFIYTQVGYDPNAGIPTPWKQFHDRVSLTYNAVPAGYFGIFKEMADMVVTLGQAGAHIDASFVPDISVGISWAAHWKKNDFDTGYGARIKFEHNFPDYFPQAASNPQEPWCYPERALGEFRRWLREEYIEGGKFAKYIEGKVAQRQLPPSIAQIAVSAYGLDHDS